MPYTVGRYGRNEETDPFLSIYERAKSSDVRCRATINSQHLPNTSREVITGPLRARRDSREEKSPRFTTYMIVICIEGDI